MSSFPFRTEGDYGVNGEEREPHHPTDSLSRSSRFSYFLRNRFCVLWSQLTLVAEISGSCGDLGTFIPLFAAMGRQRLIYAGPALFFAGLSNFLTGFAWDVPMPIQPMKSISAVALVDVLTREQVTTAGICMGVMLLLLGLSNGINLANRIIPHSVVSGMQIGVGISLSIRGLQMVATLSWADQADCILLAVLCSLLCLYLLREEREGEATSASTSEMSSGSAAQASESSGATTSCKATCSHIVRSKPPVGIVLFCLGSLIAIVELVRHRDGGSSFQWSRAPTAFAWALEGVASEDWRIGFLDGSLPQLPLSTLNSVISVCCLAHSLYPERRDNRERSATDAVLSRREVCLSVGLMNLIFCPFGAMPSCHGAGGLAGQHKLGRSST